jgi:FlaA1/EpsC-like NDP-sugar epimerase
LKTQIPTVIVGTEQTVRTLLAQLGAAASGSGSLGLQLGVEVVGCLLTEATSSCFIQRIPVLGGIGDLSKARATFGFRQAVICLPASLSHLNRGLLARLGEMGVAARIVVPLEEQLSVDAAKAQGAESAVHLPGKDIDVAELIGRVPHGIDRNAVSRILTGKRVLITGAGGSIGSEIARIVCAFKPESIILMERSENALFEIDRQISRRFPGVARKAVLHDVADAEDTLRHVTELRPQVIFHAAAHKHVPLMEDHPAHAVKNNLFGTKSIADAAAAVNAERFVLISSDKAVNPSSVMGATKRLAELYIQSLARRESGTQYSMVRFGNVLGSACSVLPIWSTQAAEGGPLTVTDARMTRYFMTIHEAAALVIQSAVIAPAAKTAAVFVLDMGEPVKILELAQRFARAHGLEPVVCEGGREPLLKPRQIAVTLTGARPGEKLHEELAYAAEFLAPTAFAGIRAWAGQLSESFDPVTMVEQLGSVRPSHDRAAVVQTIQRHVPEMRPQVGSESARPEVAGHIGLARGATRAA